MEKENITQVIDKDNLKENIETAITTLSHLITKHEKADNELSYTTRQLQNMLDEIGAKHQDFLDNLKTQKTSLNETVSILSKETKIITILPEKISNALNLAVPGIAAAIQKKATENIEKSIDEIDKRIEALNEKIFKGLQKASEFYISEFKKKIYVICFSVTLSLISSLSASYYLHKYFPAHVTVNSGGEVTVNDGNITIWGRGNNIKEKNNKK